MKVYVYKVFGDYDEEDKVTKVFDSKEKVEKWDIRMRELQDLHQKYHRDGTVMRSRGGTASCPEIIALQKEAGSEDYLGQIFEMDIE